MDTKRERSNTVDVLLKPPTAKRRAMRDAYQKSSIDSDMDDPMASAPTIIVHGTSVKEASPSTSDILPQHLHSRSSDESVYNVEAPLVLHNLHESIPEDQNLRVERFLIPPRIPYNLYTTFEGKAFKADVERTISMNDLDSYADIESAAEAQVRENFSNSLASRELNFRHGSCKIISDAGREDVHALTSQEDWKDVCITLINYQTSGPYRVLRLEVSRDYFALQTQAIGQETFAITKRREIDTLMKNSASGRYYIPRIDLTRVTSTDTIRQIITQDDSLGMNLNAKEQFIELVRRRSRTLLAMCVLANLKMRCLKKLLDAGLSDQSLPLKEQSKCHRGCSPNFRNLLREQGGFLAPVFNKIGEHKVLHSDVVIPMHFHPAVQETKYRSNVGTGYSDDSNAPMEDEANIEKLKACCGSGSYSTVYRVRIDPDHHMLSKNRNSDFALKEFKDRPQQKGVDFRQEINVLNELRQYPHDHIVCHLASWTQGGKDYILLPYAQCNLREYIDRTSFKVKDKDCLLWFLKQLRGLARALHDLHNFADPRSLDSSSNLAPPASEPRKSGWHHDIKPENILYYQDDDADHGTFRISDFGSGKIHTFRSGSVNTRSPNGTLTYEPPEAKYEQATSRPYDVWSLGCVFLELLIWAVYGNQSVNDFATERIDRRFPDSRTDEGQDDAFWQMNESGQPFLRDSVKSRIFVLNQDVLRQETQPFKEVLELTTRMLDPQRKTRIIALDLWDTFNRIFEQKKVDLAKPRDDASEKATESKSKAVIPMPRMSLKEPVRSNPGISLTEAQHDGSTSTHRASLPVNPRYTHPLAIPRDTTITEHLTVSPSDIRSPLSDGHRRQSFASDLAPPSLTTPHSRKASWSSVTAFRGSSPGHSPRKSPTPLSGEK